MKHDDLTPLVIFSLGREAQACVPRSAIPAQGCYKGDREPAFVMTAQAFYASDLPAVLRDDGQECLLYLDNQRGAWLRYGPGYAEQDELYIGRWREHSEATCRNLSAYTIIGGRYFAAY